MIRLNGIENKGKSIANILANANIIARILGEKL